MKLKCQSNITFAFEIFKHFHYCCTFSLCISEDWKENTEDVEHHPACTHQEHLHKDWGGRCIREPVSRLKFHQNQEAVLENFASFYKSSLATGWSLHWITVVPLGVWEHHHPVFCGKDIQLMRQGSWQLGDSILQLPHTLSTNFYFSLPQSIIYVFETVDDY